MAPKGSKKRIGDFDDEISAKKPRTLPKRKPPVKPPSAMNIFGLKCRGAIIAQHPGATIKDVASLINAQWQRLSSSERRRYETEADIMKAKYVQEKVKYLKWKEKSKNLAGSSAGRAKNLAKGGRKRAPKQPIIGGPPYQCSLCDKTYDQKQGLYQHRYLKHQAGGGVSPRAKRKALARPKSGQKKRAPKQPVIGGPPYQCNLCPKMYVKKQGLYQHRYLKHPGGNSGPTYECALCGKSYSKKQGLYQHRYLKHSQKSQKAAVEHAATDVEVAAPL